MNRGNQIFGLLGNPVAHSLSPVIHEAAFRAMGVQARYVPFKVEDLGRAVEGLRGLGIRGASVTMPFKEEVLALLDEVEAGARTLGAVNTILNEGGRLTGFNTDIEALISELSELVTVRGTIFAVIGAGGAARSALHGIIREGGTAIIVNRSVERGERLAAELGCPFVPLDEIGKAHSEVLINATPVGMFPLTEEVPFDTRHLGRFRVVMDLIYNPVRTRLLREAARCGCRVRNGMGMFVRQAAGQIRIWTGLDAPAAVMESAAKDELRRRRGRGK